MKSDTASELVFVYGTLRSGASNACRMEGAEFVGRGRVAGRLFRISWYPGMVLDKDAGWVTGDLFRVSPEQLGKLDEYEGLAAGEVEGSEYRRTMVTVYQSDFPDASWNAWVWEWTGPVDREKIVTSGDWMDVEQPRQAPWFTATAGICLLGFPVGIVMSALTRYYGSAAADVVRNVLSMGVLLSPFTALWATYLAKRRRERAEVARIMIFVFAFMGGILVVATILMWLLRVLA